MTRTRYALTDRDMLVRIYVPKWSTDPNDLSDLRNWQTEITMSRVDSSAVDLPEQQSPQNTSNGMNDGVYSST